MKNQMKARGLSLLLIFAILIVSVTVILPITASAEPAEIQDFSCQTLSALDLAGDDDTDLRFLFTVGSLTYDEVGFVFSKTNATPTVDGAGCVKKAASKVYSSIIANGTPQSAGENRWWVAVKLTGVPHEYFDGALYVRPYVDDGEIRYGDTIDTTVCSAANHKHGPQLLAGHCDGCNLDGVKSGEPNIYYSQKGSGNQLDKRLYSAIRGEDHFYNGNDLLIEFSILYNETLANQSGGTFDITVGDGSDFVNIKLSSDAADRYGTVVGGFSARDRNDGKGAILSTPSPAAIAADPSAKYPSIGNYGWHRVAVRVHEEAAIVEGVVAYTYTGEAYLDGNLILAFDLSKWAADNPGVLLYTASIVNDELVYNDNDAANAWGEIGIYDFYSESRTVYLGLADVYMTCGHDFVQQVEAVVAPAAASIELGGNDYSAAMYFRLAN